nr:SDR family NAD(P)-dependent oxidoreductase [Hankyongella ginsenosidimutans]
MEAAVAQIMNQTGGVDVLVNNAGFGLYGPMEEIAISEARYQFEVNLFGAAHLTQLLLPAMRAKGAGRIVNVSSMGGKIYTPSAVGTTPPSMLWKVGPTAFGSSSHLSALTLS